MYVVLWHTIISVVLGSIKKIISRFVSFQFRGYQLPGSQSMRSANLSSCGSMNAGHWTPLIQEWALCRHCTEWRHDRRYRMACDCNKHQVTRRPMLARVVCRHSVNIYYVQYVRVTSQTDQHIVHFTLNTTVNKSSAYIKIHKHIKLDRRTN